jgi:competence protein ComEC
MVRCASAAVALICLIYAFPALPGWLPGPEFIASLVVLAGLLIGPRSAAACIPALVAVLTAGWATAGRLAPELEQVDLVIRGTVCEIPRTTDKAHRFLLLTARDTLPRGFPARIYLGWYRSRLKPAAGEDWQLKVRLRRPRGLSNPGSFDFESWAWVRRIGATGYVRDSPLNRRLPASGRCRLAGMRQRLATQLRAQIDPGPVGEHLLAISVGVRNGLKPENWALLRRTGTAHLMAISGLHVGLVAGLLLVVGGRVAALLNRIALIRMGRPATPLAVGRWLAAGGATAYAALAGFSLPTVRALVMVLVFTVLAAMRRTLSGWQTLAVALFAVLLVEPAAPLQAGFWLSFWAVGLLLLASLELTTRPPQEISVARRSATLARLLRPVKAQFVLTVGLAPLSIWYFNQVSLVAPLCNLLAVPVFALLVIPLTLLATLSLFVFPPLSKAFAIPAAWCMEIILGFLNWADRVPISAWKTPPMNGLTCMLLAGLALAVIWPRPLPGRTLVIALLSVSFGFSQWSRPPALRVVVLDVGQGLAVLVQTPGHALVFDAGPAFGSGEPARSVAVSALRHFGVRKLDRLVVSHGDADHIGGAAALLESFPGAELVAPQPFDVGARSFRQCEPGMAWHWDGVWFRMLHPAAFGNWSENDASCVLLIQTENGGILLPGDIESRAEAYLVGRGALPPVDLVVAPHHGSRTSSSRAFVAATRPRFVAFSAGHRNRWGFPDAGVADRWRRVGACALFTAADGALVFETGVNGQLNLVRRQRIDARRPWREAGSALRRPCRLL